MYRIVLICCLIGSAVGLKAQAFEFGMETVTGPARTSFNGDLAGMLGFSEIEITEDQIDTAFVRFDLDAPKWLKELFPGIRIEVMGDINRQLSRNVSSVRFFARYRWIGGSFTISDPRLTEPQESKKLKNVIKSVRLSLGGKAEELAEHLAEVALADIDRIEPFFSKRYDLEGYVHLKKTFLGEEPLVEWGKRKNNTLDVEAVAGVRFTADPSPVLDLGSLLFVSERLDSLMEGGILNPVENITDEIAEAIQAVTLGNIRDPRVVPSMGYFLRGTVPVSFGGGFSVVAGAEFSIHNHLSIKGTKPMTSIYGFAGLRWNILGKNRTQ